MSALRALVVVGLVALVGCSHPAAAPATPATPAAVPELPATQQSSRPTRVDHARLNLNRAYASLIDANTGFVATRPAYADELAPVCRTSADCGGGALSCRARADGTRVCMGAGSPGDACWFNTDCVSGTCSLGDDGERTCR